MVRRLLAVGVAVVLAALLLLASWPQLLGLHRSPVFAELVAMRGLLAVLAVAGVLLLAVLAAVSKPLRGVSLLLAAVLAGAAALNLAVLAARGFENGPLPEAQPGDLTVLVWNTLEGGAPDDIVAGIALDTGADVLVLPETQREQAEGIARILDEAGRPVQLLIDPFDESDPVQSTALLVSTALGRYELDAAADPTAFMPSLVARSAEGGPTIVAAHPYPPLPGHFEAWESGLQWLAEMCRQPDVVLAGDLNATLDHFEGLREEGFELGGCRDAAKTAGGAAIGTWPFRKLPLLLGAPIDHVMASAEWEAVGFQVLDDTWGNWSDHNPVVARLRPAD